MALGFVLGTFYLRDLVGAQNPQDNPERRVSNS
jgi:hypothetical protein